MGRVSDRLVHKVNEATTADAAKVAVFSYLNKKVQPKKSHSVNHFRLRDKFCQALGGMTRHSQAAQEAYAQFMHAPLKLSKCDRKTVDKINAASSVELEGLVRSFTWDKVITTQTLKDNQRNLAGWATVVDSRLVRNRSFTEHLFAATRQTDVLDGVRAVKTDYEFRAAAASAAAVGIGVGLALGTI